MEEGAGGSSGRGEEKYKQFENQRKSETERDIDPEYQILCIWEPEKSERDIDSYYQILPGSQKLKHTH